MRLSAALAGDSFTTRAAAPVGARLTAVVVGSLSMLLSYSLLVRISERRQASELNLRQAPGDLAAGIGIGGTIMAAIICILWCGDWVVISVAPMTAVIESLKQTVQSAVIEEVLIRLIVFRMLWRAFGVWPACI